MRKLAIMGAATLAIFLLLHDLSFVSTGTGRCMVAVQPDILIGAGPGLMTELDC